MDSLLYFQGNVKQILCLIHTLGIHSEACSIHLELGHLLGMLILLECIIKFAIFSVKLAVGCTLSMGQLEELYTVSPGLHIKCLQTALRKV
jgi:hypothetical protein